MNLFSLRCRLIRLLAGHDMLVLIGADIHVSRPINVERKLVYLYNASVIVENMQ